MKRPEESYDRDGLRSVAHFGQANERDESASFKSGADNEQAQLQALQASGYATVPAYANELAAIIKGLPDDSSNGGGA